MKLERLRDAALDAAIAAGKILRGRFGSRLEIREKPGAGLVTDVDTEAEAVAVRLLRKAFPDFGMLTEESAPLQAASPGRWIIDPLDGTTNFIHGFPMFCVSIAAEWQGEIVAGVVHHPILQETYVAARGQGAWLNNTRLTVSKTAQLSDALLSTGFSYTAGSDLHRDIATFEKLSNVARAIRRPGSAALDLAYTARGVFDGFWERNLSAWDMAAGALLVQEAGGTVTDYRGGRFSTASREIIVANPSLHAALLRNISPGF